MVGLHLIYMSNGMHKSIKACDAIEKRHDCYRMRDTEQIILDERR